MLDKPFPEKFTIIYIENSAAAVPKVSLLVSLNEFLKQNNYDLYKFCLTSQQPKNVSLYHRLEVYVRMYVTYVLTLHIHTSISL